MSEKNTNRNKFSPDEKKQFTDMFRFLLLVLGVVVAASLVMAIVIPIVTQ